MSRPDHRESALALASAIGPFSADMLAMMSAQADSEITCNCHTLLHYAQKYSPARVEAAIHRMSFYGMRDLASLHFILANDLDLLALRDDADLDGQLQLPLKP